MPLKLLQRIRGEQFAESPADPILDSLLPREEIIDRYDASYIDDLPDLLREIHGITERNLREHARFADMRALWELTGRPEQELKLAELPEALLAAGVDPRRHGPKRASRSVERRYKHDRVPSWRPDVRVRRPGSGDAEAVNEIQRDYSVQQGGANEMDFHDLGRPETGDPWTPLNIRLREEGVIRADEPTLTIGPRWVGEIHYFRGTLGLQGAIGLDLFTHDEELVKVGDMHDMPFADNTFGLVYQRNTFDKSYDIRQALRECLRVLRPGGVLISDDCYAYTDGVSTLARTSIKHNRQVARVLEPHVEEVLHDLEADSEEDWIERVGQVALKLRK